MDTNKLKLPAFILLALAQLFVPAKMIFDKEEVLSTGKEFKFRIAPVDPYDAFRGKYITLLYKDNHVVVKNKFSWKPGETAYAVLEQDSAGFARISSLSKQEPWDGSDFIQVSIGYHLGASEVLINYPFDRFYMEESKAYSAEQAYNQAARDTSKTAWALVKVKDGEAVLQEVMLDGVPIAKAALSNE